MLPLISLTLLFSSRRMQNTQALRVRCRCTLFVFVLSYVYALPCTHTHTHTHTHMPNQRYLCSLAVAVIAPRLFVLIMCVLRYLCNSL